MSDAISESKSTLRKNKVSLLLDSLYQMDNGDYATLVKALADETLAAHVLTKALWKEYGADCVDDGSVSKYRTRSLRTVNGL